MLIDKRNRWVLVLNRPRSTSDEESPARVDPSAKSSAIAFCPTSRRVAATPVVASIARQRNGIRLSRLSTTAVVAARG